MNNKSKLIPRKLIGGLIPKGQWGLITRLAGKVLPAASRFGERMLTKSPRIGKLVGKTVNKVAKKTETMLSKASSRSPKNASKIARAAAKNNGATNVQARATGLAAALRVSGLLAVNATNRALPRSRSLTTAGALTDAVTSSGSSVGTKIVKGLGWFSLPVMAAGIGMNYAENDDKMRDDRMQADYQARKLGYNNAQEAQEAVEKEYRRLQSKLPFNKVPIVNNTPSVEGNGYKKYIKPTKDVGVDTTVTQTVKSDKPASRTTITPATTTSTSENYTIQQGDTLSKLARQYDTTVEKLAKLNNISNVNRIYAGLNLILPGLLTGETVEDKPLTETFSDPNASKEITIPADFTPEMLTQAFRKKLIANSQLRAIPAQNILDYSYEKPFTLHFGADRNWNGMTNEQKLNYLQTMDKAIDPNDNTFSLYDINGNLVLNQSENSSFGPLTLTELYNADKGGEFDDYMNNFRGKAWDTATDEGSKTYKGMLDYYNLNRKAVDKYAKKQKWQANSPEVFNYLYTQYNNTLPKARKGTKLIPRNKWQH